jgi:hypothetical protein
MLDRSRKSVVAENLGFLLLGITAMSISGSSRLKLQYQ